MTDLSLKVMQNSRTSFPAMRDALEKTSQDSRSLRGDLHALFNTVSDAPLSLKDLESATGTVDEAFLSFKNGVGAFDLKINQTNANLEIFAIKLGQEILPRLSGGLDIVLGFSKGLAETDSNTLALITDLGEVIVATAGMTAVVVGAQKAWEFLTIKQGLSQNSRVGNGRSTTSLKPGSRAKPSGACADWSNGACCGHEETRQKGPSGL